MTIYRSKQFSILPVLNLVPGYPGTMYLGTNAATAVAVYRSHDKLFPSISLSIFSFLESWVEYISGLPTRGSKWMLRRERYYRSATYPCRSATYPWSTETARAHVTFIDFLVTKCTVGTAVYTAVLIFILVLVTHVHTTNIHCMQTLHSCTSTKFSRSTRVQLYSY